MLVTFSLDNLKYVNEGNIADKMRISDSPPPDRGDIGGEILFEVDERNFDGLSGLHKGRPKNVLIKFQT